MEIKERISKFIDYLGTSVYAFEKKCRIANGTLGNDCKTIRSDYLENIMNNYPRLNGDWLLMGRGEMLYEDNFGKEPVTAPAEYKKVRHKDDVASDFVDVSNVRMEKNMDQLLFEYVMLMKDQYADVRSQVATLTKEIEELKKGSASTAVGA